MNVMDLLLWIDFDLTTENSVEVVLVISAGKTSLCTFGSFTVLPGYLLASVKPKLM